MALKQGLARTRSTRDIHRVVKKRMKYGHLEGRARTGWNMDSGHLEGGSKNSVEYGHLEGEIRTGWNLDT
jgi:hypothetical protein